MKRLYKAVDRMMGHRLSAARLAGRHRQAKQDYNAYMTERLGRFMKDVDPGPVGDEEIVLRTAVLSEEDASRKTNPDYYFSSGYRTLLAWLRHLEHYSFNIRTVGAIMELGCGSGRLLRHLRCIDGVRLVGTDVVPEFIEWCQQSLPGIEFHVNDLQPPLPFAEDNSFDLVLAASVFTHIPLETQSQWIKEMHRVVRPGGFFLATVLGNRHQRLMLDAQQRERLKREGQLQLDSTELHASVSTRMIGSWDVFQTREQVLRAFGSVFQVCDYVPRGLDLLILQKVDGL